jgi:hypothetical protein
MTKINGVPIKVIMHDLNQSAIHEAGHLVAARVVKLLTLGIELRLNPTPDHMEERSVTGCVRWHRHGKPLPRRRVALFGLAGVVAEAIDADPEAGLHDIFCHVEDLWLTASDTDIAAAGRLTWAKVRDTHDILLPRWDEVVQEAEWAKASFLEEHGIEIENSAEEGDAR